MNVDSEPDSETESDASLPPIPLESRADVKRALANCLRRIERGGKRLKLANEHALIIGYGTLAKMMKEDHEEETDRRLAALEAKTDQ